MIYFKLNQFNCSLFYLNNLLYLETVLNYVTNFFMPLFSPYFVFFSGNNKGYYPPKKPHLAKKYTIKNFSTRFKTVSKKMKRNC